MTIKERMLKHVEAMDEAQLAELEQYFKSTSGEGRLDDEFRLLEELAAPMSGEDQEIFEAAVRRRPFFGERKLEVEPDGS